MKRKDYFGSRITTKQALFCLGLLLSTLVSCGGKKEESASPHPPASAPAPAETIAPQPAQAPAAAAEEVPPRPENASWNAWFERAGRLANVLQAGARYELVLDLSRYRYLDQLSAPVGPEVAWKIKESRDMESVRFVVRPFSLDDKLRLEATEGVLDTKLARLSNQVENEAQLYRSFVDGGTGELHKFAHSVQAGEVHFGIQSGDAGCAAIALSVWDETGSFPLDHLIMNVPVAAAGKPAPACGSTGESRAVLEKDAHSLLAFSLERTPLKPTPVASLHIFEFKSPALGDRPRTAVVMVDHDTYERTKRAQGVYSWVTKSLLSDYISRPEQLQAQIDEARNQARDNPYAYAPVARELATKLFSQESGATNAAKEAREALRRAAAEDSSPVIVVRMVRLGEHIFIPLGLLGARADKPVLAHPLTVIEPLPVERSSHACIGTWTLAIPDRLELSSSESIDLSSAPQITGFAGRRLKTEGELSSYMEDMAGADTAEGLILLAHQSGGFLSFSGKEADRVPYNNLNRSFRPGSVAVLSACATAKPEGTNLAWATELNAKGIDAMVVSPFPVPADYGARLALEFAGAVSKARASGASPTFLELFHSAARASATYFPGHDELELEFVVAGDPDLRLCASK